jgi:DNA-damage-inducible protein D
MLGYEIFASFENVINKAIAACMALKISVADNFQQTRREIEGKPTNDYKLSRFACYLSAMNGDSRKQQVAAAQAYFASMAETVRQYIEGSDCVERVLIRDEVSDRERSLSGVAKSAGVVQYGYFQNAGYRGLYNMNLSQLRKVKGIDQKRSPLDFMGKAELAANLFRITQTEEKLRNEHISGQRRAEAAAESVGKTVRKTMIEISGRPPERLTAASDIVVVKKGLKAAEKVFSKIDSD